jgi:hypothetical protein
MAFKHVAVQGMTLAIDEIGVTATLTPTTPPSLKNKAGSPLASAYFGNVAVTVAAATDGVCTQTAPQVATLKPTATEVSSGGDKVLRVDDEAATLAVAGTDGGGNPCTINVTVYVSDAGQNKVSAQ